MRERKLEEEFGRIRRERGENPLQGFFFLSAQGLKSRNSKDPSTGLFSKPPSRHLRSQQNTEKETFLEASRGD